MAASSVFAHLLTQIDPVLDQGSGAELYLIVKILARRCSTAFSKLMMIMAGLLAESLLDMLDASEVGYACANWSSISASRKKHPKHKLTIIEMM